MLQPPLMEQEKYVLTGVNNDTCPTRIMLSAIEGKWKMLLIYHLFNGCQRPGDLERLLPDARRQVLMQQLKELESDGLIRKKIYAQVPPKVEYYLTDMGTSLEPMFRQMYAWGHAHAPQIRANQGSPVFESNCQEG